MEHQFKTNGDTFLAERHGYILTKFRKENIGHASLIERINGETETLKTSMSVEAWTAIEKLLDLLRLQSHQECKLLYTQGAFDCIEFCHYLKSEHINSDYIE